jgi:hypothetical protein
MQVFIRIDLIISILLGLIKFLYAYCAVINWKSDDWDEEKD